MTDPTPAPGWADDPSAPYFETLWAAARILAPNGTRAELLAALREVDPDDTLRIREPYCSRCDHDRDPACQCSCHRRHRAPEVTP